MLELIIKFSKLEDFKINIQGFPGGSMVKNPPANAEHMGSIPGPEDRMCHSATKPT